MNGQITRLAVGTIVLLSALIIGTTYWQTFAVAGLADRQDNALARVATFTVDRGKIYAGHGRVLLATNVKKKVSGQTYYFRKYPNGYLAPHIVGYSTQSRSRAGLERSPERLPHGRQRRHRERHEARARQAHGRDDQGQRHRSRRSTCARRRRPCGRCAGSAAPPSRSSRRPGGSSQSPRARPTTRTRSRRASPRSRASARRACPFAAPLLDRATQGLYPPGSTFKVVTASAALDSGAFKPDSTFNDPGYCEEYGKRVSNAGNPESPETFGTVTLAQGLQHSINSVFCNVGKKIGAGKILDYAERYGFYASPDVELPADAQSPSGLYRSTSRTSRSTPSSRSTRAGSRLVRSGSSSRPCRWRWSPRRSRTAAC